LTLARSSDRARVEVGARLLEGEIALGALGVLQADDVRRDLLAARCRSSAATAGSALFSRGGA
jgi:hypothetical protein